MISIFHADYSNVFPINLVWFANVFYVQVTVFTETSTIRGLDYKKILENTKTLLP